MMILSLLLLMPQLLQVSAFSLAPVPSLPKYARYSSATVSTAGSGPSMFDYEYIPNNSNSEDGFQNEYATRLASVYPDGTPAGMRGEAVRAALRSGRCLAWKLETATPEEDAASSPNLASGLLQLQGKGVLDFLNNKLSNSFVASTSGGGADDDTETLDIVQACLLTPKGRLVDTLSVAYSQNNAFVMPSPGHTGSSLFQRLDPFIFPMDQVKLTDLSNKKKDNNSNLLVFTIASTDLEHVEATVSNQLLPKLRELVGSISLDDILPSNNAPTNINHPQGRLVTLGDNDENRLLVIPLTGLPDCACVGYTFAFFNDQMGAGNQLWTYLIGDDNPQGPVEIRGLEYETLRIEAGCPAFGSEVTGAWKDPPIKGVTSPTPLELHQKTDVIDFDKGCYLGQEGIASIVKNPRGPPRSLYSVVFEDEDNIYQYQSEGDKSKVDNLTKMPKAGDKLFVLGSNEEIEIGTVTSVAEPYGTGVSTIVALALVRRADSILKQMKSKDLQISRGLAANLASSSSIDTTGESSGIIEPPPMDSLDGLEVIVGGTFTVGVMRGVPSRRFRKGRNMFVDQGEAFQTREEGIAGGYVDIDFSGMSPSDFLNEKREELDNTINDDDDDDDESEEVKTPEAEDNVEDEAQRKAAKMAMLKQRADEAMARRKNMKLAAKASQVEAPMDDDAEAAEAKRKAEKMMLLQQRAEEAMARRKKKREAEGK